MSPWLSLKEGPSWLFWTFCSLAGAWTCRESRGCGLGTFKVNYFKPSTPVRLFLEVLGFQVRKEHLCNASGSFCISKSIKTCQVTLKTQLMSNCKVCRTEA